MTLRPRIRVGLVLATLLSLTACGSTADRDFCTQFDDLVAAVDEFQQLDPLTAKAEDLRAASDELEAELDQLQAVSEGRLDSAISTLRASVDAVRQAAIAAGEDASDTARPLQEDAMDDVAQAWANVQDLVDMQCDVA